VRLHLSKLCVIWSMFHLEPGDQQLEVIDSALASAIALHHPLPQTIAQAVFTTILNASVSFEVSASGIYIYMIFVCVLIVSASSV
jgi:hypothetical protein